MYWSYLPSSPIKLMPKLCYYCGENGNKDSFPIYVAVNKSSVLFPLSLVVYSTSLFTLLFVLG